MYSRRIAYSVLVCALLATFALAQPPTGPCIRGRATAYVIGSEAGACGFGSHRPEYTFAPNEAFFNGSNTCGACYEVSGPLGTQIFMAADLCPVAGNAQHCSGDMPHFDLNSAVSSSIFADTWGVSYTSIRPVVCPNAGNIAIITHAGCCETTYLQVYFFNYRVPIDSVRVKDSSAGSNFQKISRQSYNAFEWNAAATIVYPVSYELTSVYGEIQVVTLNAMPSGAGKVISNKQFTVWPTNVAVNTCPSFYEYDILINGGTLNNGAGKPTAELWQSAASAQFGVTANPPPGMPTSAQFTFPNWQEWYFGTRGAPIPASTVASVELWARSSSTVNNIQIAWGSYGLGHVVTLGAITSTWTKFTFQKSQFGTSLPDFDVISLKNNNNAQITIQIANYKIVPVPSAATPSSAPAPAPTASPAPTTPVPTPNTVPTISPSPNSPSPAPAPRAPTPTSTPSPSTSPVSSNPAPGSSSQGPSSATNSVFEFSSLLAVLIATVISLFAF